MSRHVLPAGCAQAVYSERMACMRVVALVALGRHDEACQACLVSYQAPTGVTNAPWRMWLSMQARYLAGSLEVRGLA